MLASKTSVIRCGGVVASINLVVGRLITWVLAPFMEDEEGAKRNESKAQKMVPHQGFF